MIAVRTLAFLCLASAAFAADPSTGKKLVFSDDFNGDKLDETKWVVHGARDTLSFVKVGKENALRIGLKMGADDFIKKPFSQRLLVERVKAVLRRASAAHAAAAHAEVQQAASAFRVLAGSARGARRGQPAPLRTPSSPPSRPPVATRQPDSGVGLRRLPGSLEAVLLVTLDARAAVACRLTGVTWLPARRTRQCL